MNAPADSILGIDLGTTAIKASVYRLDGRSLGAAYLEYPLASLGEGRVEQDAAQWWSVTGEVISLALAQAGVSGQSVQALAISSQGISFVPVDAEGAPLRPALCWLDTRATAEAEAISAAVGDEALFRLTGKRAGADYVLPKLLWLRAHEPDVFAHTARYLMAHDYVVHRLCGAALTDYSLAGGTLLLDLHRLCWSEDLLGRFELAKERLPGLAWAGSVAGQIRRRAALELGLNPAALVAVGGQDQKCAVLGAGIRPGRVAVSLGTAAAISCLVPRPALDATRRVPLFPFVVPGYWVLEGVIGAAGAALRWLRDTLFPAQTYAALDALAAASPPGSHGVRFYPHLAGATSPHWQEQATGAWTGLTLSTGSGDLIRSVLEGVAYEIRCNLEAMAPLTPSSNPGEEESAGSPGPASLPPDPVLLPSVEELLLFGGGSRSILWADILCQVTGLPVSGAG